MTKAIYSPRLFSPFWADDGVRDGFGVNISGALTDVNFVTTPTLPWSARNERWVEMVNGGAVLVVQSPDDGNYSNTGPSSLATNRAYRRSITFRINSTAPNADTRLMSLGADNGGIYYLYLRSSDLKLELRRESTVIATGTTALAVDTNYQVSAFMVSHSGGVDLGVMPQWMVQLIGSITGTPIVSTEINAQFVRTGGLDPGANTTLGGAGGTSGFRWYWMNYFAGWEDSGDPYGVVRIERMDTDGVSALRNQFPGTEANVDESGTALPDDATTVELPGAVVDEKQLYTLETPATITTGDSVAAIATTLRFYAQTAVKGNGNTTQALISDGAAENEIVIASQGQSAYEHATGTFRDYPGSTGITPAQLASLESGVHFGSSAPGGDQFRLTTVLTEVAYQASGQDTGALPPPPLLLRRREAFVHQVASH